MALRKKLFKKFIHQLPKHGRATYIAFSLGFLLLLASGSGALYHIHQVNLANQKKATQQLVSSAPSQATTTKPTPQPITAASIVSLLNQQRTAKGLPALKWITQLDTAAVARANYMVANNTTSTTMGDPGADITDANYSYSNALWSDTWNESTTQGAITSLTTGGDSNFGYSTAYSDIGVGVVPDTIDGSSTQLIFVYLANQATSSSQTNNSSQAEQEDTPPPVCPIGETGIWPDCEEEQCPEYYTGTYPDCTYDPTCIIDIATDTCD